MTTAALQTDTPWFVWIFFVVLGVVLIRFARVAQTHSAKHPLVPGSLAKPAGIMGLGMAWFFGLAFMCVGTLGLFVALS